MDRQRVFLQLKPACVHLLQVTASFSQQGGAPSNLIKALADLVQTLHSINSQGGVLDAKLTEYVFVPISQVLRISQTVPVRALELCLECISLLLRGSWGGELAPELSGQLLILFTFMAKPSSAQSGIPGSSEELQGLALKCMTELFDEISRSSTGKQHLTATSSIPALGEAVLVVLDNLTNSLSGPVKLHAASVIRSLISAIDDRDALASFLPRMVSSLTKVLTPSSSNRVNFRVLESCLQSMRELLLLLLNDKETKDLPKSTPGKSDERAKATRSLPWLQATASQLKVALSNILKLRQHEKLEVQKSLLALCSVVVQECRGSLAECVGMVIETMVMLAGRGESKDTVEEDLKNLLLSDDNLSTLLQESLYGWVIALPRFMQSKDDMGRRQIIQQIAVTLRLLNNNQAIIGDLLAEHLREGVSTVLGDSKRVEFIAENQSLANLNKDMGLSASISRSFGPFPFHLKGQQDVMADFSQLLAELAVSDTAVSVAQDLVSGLRAGSQVNQLASFWISVNLVRDMMRNNPSIHEFIDLGTINPHEELLDSLYSHSVEILTQQNASDVQDWRICALALEVIAMQAGRYKAEFRTELSEVLYPMLYYLGSTEPELRNHAIICLNIVSNTCGYSSASELVVANVDYVINAVGLRLSYGDVSPQAPQVLLMMMRLCGPSLLPYLDDLVGAIFGALERYHGYPKLVELLFTVLKGMAEEGVKAPQLAITASQEHLQGKEERNDVTTMRILIESIKKTEQAANFEQSAHFEELKHENFPKKPWEEATDLSKDDQTSESRSPEKPSPDPPPPEPLTFSILLKISELTQYYLTSSSPSLRASLINLLQTTIPALAKHENSFLPLINTLWPVLISRLEDPEAYVVANSLDIVAMMCEFAQNFMGSRIDAAWDLIKLVFRRTINYEKRMKSSNSKIEPARVVDLSGITAPTSQSVITNNISTGKELYIDAPTRMIRDSLVHLLCSIAKHVGIKEEQFDDLLNMLDSVLEREDVQLSLGKRNYDAVWLKLYQREHQRIMGEVKEKKKPESNRWNFVQV
ncbi:hypothetical protein DM02DRAFT_582754 [Periconia macrospinosa]|uniref:ARM repeat-containing protein n=1 Tax=Periconia macrospinosa TaxID=97972 RepID=A0A2V1E892_9PLEO|nr:hypothetical protein DM02DRAFT_582754 [Periconia macrospinosa]